MVRIFMSAGEPSGDLHGSNLIRNLQQQDPSIECVGFGGDRMEAAGARLIYPLCRLAVMGFRRVFTNVHAFVSLLRLADRYFRDERPDAVVLIDYPGFHWWLARRARAHGIPTFYFVPPQLWGWAGWRVRKMRRSINHVLCSLPFEEPWYHARSVPAQYLGHPYFDELAQQKLNTDFVASERNRPGIVIGLLPGSRDQELEWNLDTLLRAAGRIHASRPDARFLVACLRPAQRQYVEARLRDAKLPIDVHAGRTPEIIHLSHSCITVSGSVSLELLHHGKPAVVVYRAGRVPLLIASVLKTVPYITLVNLLADRELFPEFLGNRCEAEPAANHVIRWLNEPQVYQSLRNDLAALREQVAKPGACARTAEYILTALRRLRTSSVAA